MRRSHHDIATTTTASQGAAELEWLLNEMELVAPKRILEIGVHNGRSMRVWEEAFSPTTMVGVDYEPTDELLAYLQEPHAESVSMFNAESHRPSTVRAVWSAFGYRQIDFLFLDGGHLYADVAGDFAYYSPMVRPGGMIAFHDASLRDNPLVQIREFLQALEDEYPVVRCCIDFTGVAYVRVP